MHANIARGLRDRHLAFSIQLQRLNLELAPNVRRSMPPLQCHTYTELGVFKVGSSSPCEGASEVDDTWWTILHSRLSYLDISILTM